ncbi:hypothetical protein E2C01_058000 [Portunus trituberculatus]|uniref:Uncharacterized protein n=1 Tax=Portunus trituberculatus TaxID=210409 RepID=A0A5B7GYG8_PORTR|nr:hypothetical protein [Portunus trituberculatus]
MHLPHTYTLHLKFIIKKWQLQTQPRSPLLGKETRNVHRSDSSLAPPTFSILTYATFAVLDLIFNLWNTTSPLLNLILFSSLKHSCLRLLTVAPSLFPPTYSILIFVPKLDVASVCATT